VKIKFHPTKQDEKQDEFFVCVITADGESCVCVCVWCERDVSGSVIGRVTEQGLVWNGLAGGCSLRVRYFLLIIVICH
jgi:hypothetical protein